MRISAPADRILSRAASTRAAPTRAAPESRYFRLFILNCVVAKMLMISNRPAKRKRIKPTRVVCESQTDGRGDEGGCRLVFLDEPAHITDTMPGIQVHREKYSRIEGSAYQRCGGKAPTPLWVVCRTSDAGSYIKLERTTHLDTFRFSSRS